MSETIEETLIKHMNHIGKLTQQRDDLRAKLEKAQSGNLDIIKRCNKLSEQRDDLLAACKAWMKVESEMSDKHPCPDLALRAKYRKEAVSLTKAAITLCE